MISDIWVSADRLEVAWRDDGLITVHETETGRELILAEPDSTWLPLLRDGVA